MAEFTIELKATGKGTILPLLAQPGSRKSGIQGVHDGRLKIAVHQVAEKGKANQEIMRLLAAELGLPKSQITLVSGETNSRKNVLLSGVTPAEAQQRIEALIRDSA